MLNNQNNLIARFKQMVHKAMICAKQLDEYLHSENPDKIMIVAYLNQAESFMHSAEAIYSSKIDDLQHDKIDELFSQFQVFTYAVMQYLNLNHPWTKEEYDQLRELFYSSGLSQ